MYDKLLERLHYCRNNAAIITDGELVGVVDSAADAIEELSKQVELEYQSGFADGQIAVNRKRPRWIPVTERLPLYGQDVLAVRSYGDGEKCQEVLTAHISVWNEETGEKWWNATNITHWMPLPDPPKEE